MVLSEKPENRQIHEYASSKSGSEVPENHPLCQSKSTQCISTLLRSTYPKGSVFRNIPHGCMDVQSARRPVGAHTLFWPCCWQVTPVTLALAWARGDDRVCLLFGSSSNRVESLQWYLLDGNTPTLSLYKNMTPDEMTLSLLSRPVSCEQHLESMHSCRGSRSRICRFRHLWLQLVNLRLCGSSPATWSLFGTGLGCSLCKLELVHDRPHQPSYKYQSPAQIGEVSCQVVSQWSNDTATRVQRHTLQHTLRDPGLDAQTKTNGLEGPPFLETPTCCISESRPNDWLHVLHMRKGEIRQSAFRSARWEATYKSELSTLPMSSQNNHMDSKQTAHVGMCQNPPTPLPKPCHAYKGVTASSAAQKNMCPVC